MTTIGLRVVGVSLADETVGRFLVEGSGLKIEVEEENTDGWYEVTVETDVLAVLMGADEDGNMTTERKMRYNKSFRNTFR